MFFLFVICVFLMYSMNSLYLWVLLELVLFLIIYMLIMQNSSFMGVISIFNYLIINVVAGIMILSGIIVEIFYSGNMYPFMSCSNYISYLFLISGLLMKLSMYPFYYQICYLFMVVDLNQCMVMMMIPKFIPMYLLIELGMPFFLNKTLILYSVFMVLLSSVNGIFYSDIRGILAFSSISFLSFFILLLPVGNLFFFFYFLFYYMIISAMIYYLNKYNSGMMIKLTNLQSNLNLKLILLVCFFTLASQPLFYMFFYKLAIMYFVFSLANFVLLMFLISYVGNMFYYLRVSLFFFSSNYSYNNMNNISALNMPYILYTIMTMVIMSVLVVLVMF